jgi:hypothetical protein
MATDNIEFIEVKDALLTLDDHKKFGLENHGSEILFSVFPAQSNNITSTISITATPSDQDTYVDPKVYAKASFVVTLNGTGVNGSVGGPLDLIGLNQQPTINVAATKNIQLINANHAPRFMPISQTTSNLTYTLNSSNYSTSLSEYVEPMMRTSFNRDMLNEQLSCAPTMQDNVQVYNDYDPQIVGTNNLVASSNYNVFSRYGVNTYQEARGGWYIDSVTQSGTINAAQNVIVFTVVEPLFISPFWTSKQALTRLRTMVFQWNFSNMARCWSYYNKLDNNGSAVGPQVTSISAYINNLSVLVKQIKAKSYEKIPKVINYAFNDILILTKTNPNLLSNASDTFVIGATNLQAIPKQVLVYARLQTASQTATSADTYGRITNINVQYGNRNGLLASMDEAELYQQSVKEGLQMSFTQWKQWTGSIFLLNIPRLVGLKDGEAPGVMDNPAFSIQAQVQNISRIAQVYTLYCIVIYDGLMTIDEGGKINYSLNILGKQKAIEVEKLPSVVGGRRKRFKFYKKGLGMYGGDLLSDIGHIADFAGPALKVASLIGGKKLKRKHNSRRKKMMKLGKALIGGRKKQAKKSRKNKRRGYGLYGGQVIDRESLKDMAENLEINEYSDESDESEDEQDYRGGNIEEEEYEYPVEQYDPYEYLEKNGQEAYDQADFKGHFDRYFDEEEEEC